MKEFFDVVNMKVVLWNIIEGLVDKVEEIF